MLKSNERVDLKNPGIGTTILIEIEGGTVIGSVDVGVRQGEIDFPQYLYSPRKGEGSDRSPQAELITDPPVVHLPIIVDVNTLEGEIA